MTLNNLVDELTFEYKNQSKTLKTEELKSWFNSRSLAYLIKNSKNRIKKETKGFDLVNLLIQDKTLKEYFNEEESLPENVFKVISNPSFALSFEDYASFDRIKISDINNKKKPIFIGEIVKLQHSDYYQELRQYINNSPEENKTDYIEREYLIERLTNERGNLSKVIVDYIKENKKLPKRLIQFLGKKDLTKKFQKKKSRLYKKTLTTIINKDFSEKKVKRNPNSKNDYIDEYSPGKTNGYYSRRHYVIEINDKKFDFYLPKLKKILTSQKLIDDILENEEIKPTTLSYLIYKSSRVSKGLTEYLRTKKTFPNELKELMKKRYFRETFIQNFSDKDKLQFRDTDYKLLPLDVKEIRETFSDEKFYDNFVKSQNKFKNYPLKEDILRHEEFSRTNTSKYIKNNIEEYGKVSNRFFDLVSKKYIFKK